MNVKRAFDISRTSFVFARRSFPDRILVGGLRTEAAAPISIGFLGKSLAKNL